VSTEGNPQLWKALYADPVPLEQTGRECDFIEHFMPRDQFPALLDLACAAGRHTLEMASRGYDVTGVDINVKALQVAAMLAAERGVSAAFIPADLRELDHLDGTFDGVLLFWQSFGFFDNTIQVGLFTQLHRMLRPGGRLILDLYNGLFYMRGADFGIEAGEELQQLYGTLDAHNYPLPVAGYEDDLRFESRRRVDILDPHLFTPGEISGLAANHSFEQIAICSEYSPEIAATREHQKMQLVFGAL
jgi:SAM-dependent methyltransferase